MSGSTFGRRSYRDGQVETRRRDAGAELWIRNDGASSRRVVINNTDWASMWKPSPNPPTAARCEVPKRRRPGILNGPYEWSGISVQGLVVPDHVEV